MSPADTRGFTPDPPPALPGSEERRRQLTREALADVEAGRGLPHEAVKAWAARLGIEPD